jgi:hypothetical protein
MSQVFNRPGMALGICLLILAPVAGQQNSSPTGVQLETLGPKVGDALPEFSLRDQTAQVKSLKSLLGPNGAIIVFFRSADW